MKKNIIILNVLFVLLFLPICKAFAIDTECSLNEQARLRKAAMDTSFQYVEHNYDMGTCFDVKIVGFTSDMYVAVAKDRSISFSHNEGTDYAISLCLLPGETELLDFYATNNTKCPNQKILTKTLQVPYYNYYANNPICDGLEDYPLCQKYTKLYTSISSEEEFVKRVSAYKESLVKDTDDDNVKEPTKNETTLLDSILKFLANDYLYFLIAIIIAGSTGIVIIITKKRRSIL